VVDLQTLQAVITHRYDVLSKYLKSLRQIAAEEFDKLKVDARHGRTIKRLLHLDSEELDGSQKARLDSVLARSDRLSKVYAMRAELEALWARSTASHEQLLKQLQNWIHEAEQSGIRQLEELSLRLRSYAV